MCLTQDGLALSHAEQAEQLCRAGAKWIQLRAKTLSEASWLESAREVTAICRGYGALVIINDRVDLALAVEADGVHLGKQDLGWAEARRLLGPNRLLGGTVNNCEDAERARAFGQLDYVGVGPLRFTTTKLRLAQVLGLEGIRPILEALEGLPAWVIGGVEAADLPGVRKLGASGVAVSSALFRGGTVDKNVREFLQAWSPTESLLSSSL